MIFNLCEALGSNVRSFRHWEEFPVKIIVVTAGINQTKEYSSSTGGGMLSLVNIKSILPCQLGIGDGFPNTSLVLVEHGYNADGHLRAGCDCGDEKSSKR